MDQNHFARLTGVLSAIPSRRDVVRGLASGLGLGVARRPELADAKQKRHEKRKKKCPKPPKPGTPNAFGCLDVGVTCTDSDQCCSGICGVEQGKAQCRAHNARTCAADADFCNTEACDGCSLQCGTDGLCFRTTGNANFCGREGPCSACAKDSDCEPTHGPGAACIVCQPCIGVNGGITSCLAAA